MKQRETIGDVQKIFTHIVNHLKGLGIIFEEEDINVKELKSLNRTWQPNITTISESKDLVTMTHVELFRKFGEYEMDFTRMTEDEAIGKKNRGLSLKTSITSSDESADDNADGSDTESLNLLVRRFNKFLKKKNNYENRTFHPRRISRKMNYLPPTDSLASSAERQNILRQIAPIYQKKQQGEKKNKGSLKKKKIAYITWDDNESTNSSENSEEEQTILCLMANNEAESEVIIFYLEVNDNNDQLLDAFYEMHQQAQKLAIANNLLKGKLRRHVDNLLEI